MNECTATGTITLCGMPIRVICNLTPHDGQQHHDVVHGDWTSITAGACYTRDDGWFHPARNPTGKIERIPITTEAIQAAGLPEQPELADGITMLVQQEQPFRNLIPRR